MQAIQVLFVEDDASQLELFQEAAAAWNAAHQDQRIDIAHAAMTREAKSMIIFGTSPKKGSVPYVLLAPSKAA